MKKRDHFVYRVFDVSGELLYVGCTKRPEARWREHRHERPEMVKRAHRFHMQGPFPRSTARAVELAALGTESPAFGWTPQRHSMRAAETRRIRQRTRDLIRQGVDPTTATYQAVDELSGP